MRVTITAAGQDGAATLRSLRQWLDAERQLAGQVRLAEPAPEPDRLGAVVDTLIILLGPGGAATALASVMISWIRRRTGAETIKVSRPDGTSIEISATHVRNLDATGVRSLVEDVSRLLAPEAAQPEAAQPDPSQPDVPKLDSSRPESAPGRARPGPVIPAPRRPVSEGGPEPESNG